ncbi:AMP-binding protein [Pseudoalteromonas sp. S16_S37]|nr:AMP-binding protein [Pseudoalteromonas sp. S16_S37]
MNALIQKLKDTPPEQIVLVDEQHHICAKQLILQVELLAEFINAQQVSCVAHNIANGLTWVALDLALTLTRSAVLPLPTFFSQTQCDFAIQKAGAQLFISQSELEAHVALDTLTVFEQKLWVYYLPKQDDVALFAGTQKITFTSGSTGQPKGVCLSLDSQLAVAKSLCERINLSAPKHLCVLPLGVLLENIAGVYAPMLSGGQVKVLPIEKLGFCGSQLKDGEALLSAISQYQPNSLILVPELLKFMLLACEQGWQPPSSLAFIAVGGAHVSKSMLEKAKIFGLPVFQGYGLSEASSVVCLNTKAQQDGSVGAPLDHIQIKTIESQLYIKGPIFLGYLGEAAHPKEQWYATGDLVNVEEQTGTTTVTIIGRKKNQIINSFGRNIAPEWPESLLQNASFPIQVVVCGEAKPYLCALIWAPENISNDLLSQHVEDINRLLPDYAQVARWHRLDVPLSTQAGLLSANGRPKREAIAHFYAPQINALYSFEQEKPMTTFYDELQAQTQTEREYLLSAPIIKDVFEGQITLGQYGSFLQQAYHHVKHTVPLLMACGSKLDESKEWLREAIGHYIEEEMGHQEWILNDLAQCGFDKEAVRHSAPSFATELMVSYAYDSINRVNPLCFFGMVNVLEGTSIALADQAAQSIGKQLNLPQKAFSYLTSHGALDIEHIDFFKGLMNKIECQQERQLIIHSARCFYRLYGDVFRSIEAQPSIDLTQEAS